MEFRKKISPTFSWIYGPFSIDYAIRYKALPSLGLAVGLHMKWQYSPFWGFSALFNCKFLILV